MTQGSNEPEPVEFPIGTIAYYGPNDQHATKVAVGIVYGEDCEPEPISRWMSGSTDVRSDPKIQNQIEAFLSEHGVKQVGSIDRIIGCPHEEGLDYPEGMKCPMCPFWADKDRWNAHLEE